MLREAAITIVVDESASFSYSALEAIKSGCITMVKVPKNELDWTSGDDQYPNCCVWFDDFDTLHQQIASVVRSWITDKVPSVLEEKGDEVTSQYTRERTEKEFLAYVEDVFMRRKNEMKSLLTQIKKADEEK